MAVHGPDADIDALAGGGSDGELDLTDVDARCADFVHTFGSLYGWSRATTLFGVPWGELLELRFKIAERSAVEAGQQTGFDVNETGPPPDVQEAQRDKTQGPGTREWRRAIEMGLKLNAKKRRN